MPRLRSGPPASLYVAGPFAMGYTEFYNFLIPLYGLSLGMSAGAIGMLVGARSLLAVFLSIHVGVLMDRFGTRRGTLFFVAGLNFGGRGQVALEGSLGAGGFAGAIGNDRPVVFAVRDAEIPGGGFPEMLLQKGQRLR